MKSEEFHNVYIFLFFSIYLQIHFSSEGLFLVSLYYCMFNISFNHFNFVKYVISQNLTEIPDV